MSKKPKTKINVKDTAMLPAKAKEVKGGSFSWGVAQGNTSNQFLKLESGGGGGAGINFLKW